MRKPARKSSRRTAAQVNAWLRAQIHSGLWSPGDYLPPIREISRTQGAASVTVFKVLRQLESDGIVEAQPRKGYRLRRRIESAATTRPIALLVETELPPDQWRQNAFLNELQHACGRTDRPLLTMNSGGKSPGELVDQLVAMRVTGLIFTAYSPSLIRAIKASGIPAVMAGAWHPEAGIDAVVQDDFQGGYLAAESLLQKGCQNLVWFGPLGKTQHSLQRFGGACAALGEVGLCLSKDSICAPPLDVADGEVEFLLKSAHLPDGILALWFDRMLALKKACDRLGLVIGKDLHAAGWSEQARIEDSWQTLFQHPPFPDMVSWSAQEMADVALRLLDRRLRNPDEPPVRTVIPVELRTAGSARKSHGEKNAR